MYLNHPSDRANACTMYRNINPLKYVKGEVEVRYINQVESQIDFDPINRKVTGVKLDAEPIEWADIVVFSRHYDQVSLMGCLAEVARSMSKIVVYETDDLLHKVDQNLGGHNGKSSITDQMRFVDYLIPHVDMLTVSTEYLKEFYEKKYGKPTFVLNNYYDPAIWRGLYQYKKLRDFWRKKVKRDDTIRIGWQGGNNHFLNNFNYIVDPLNDLAKKYGKKIQFVAMAGQHPNLDPFGGKAGKRKFLEFDFEYRTPAPINKFPKALAECDLDIGLIVVEDNEFSRAKSNIKWMEYGLLGIPSISSDVLPYQDTNAVLVDNSPEKWLEAMEDLINNSDKRAIIGERAHQEARCYNIKNQAWQWVSLYQKALAGELSVDDSSESK